MTPRRPPRLRAVDDENLVPARVAIVAQELIAAILGDDPMELDELAPVLARLADATCEGHPDPWTGERVIERVRVLDELYNPPGPVCRVCGCTDLQACGLGCSWVPDPQRLGALCSVCLPQVEELLGAVS